VNKKGIIQAFYGGSAEPAVNPMPKSLWGHNDDIKDYEYDLEKAKKLLADAGYPNVCLMNIHFMRCQCHGPYMPDG